MEYAIHIGIFFVIYSMLGLSLNFVIGYTGLFSITHAAFYGIGAYTTAILSSQYDTNFFLSLACGAVITALVSFLIGIVMSRFNKEYYAIVTLGFNIIVFAIIINWSGLTRGPHGISVISTPSLFGYEFVSNLSFFVLLLIVLALIILACRFIINSSFGRVLKAIREDEKSIQIYGYNTAYYKLVIFIISAVIASTSGSFYASYMTYINPHMFTLNESIFILVIIILGGLSTLRGSVFGALFLILLPEALRFVGIPSVIAAQARQTIYGIIIMILMLFRPQGLIGEYRL